MLQIKNSLFLFSIICLSTLFSCSKEIQYDNEIDTAPTYDAITFILGNDEKADNPFYKQAEIYYRYNETHKTDEVITHIHTLSEVQDYLIKYAPDNNQAWDLINLVTHGNQYLGLSAKVSPHGKRATTAKIKQAISEGILTKMPNNCINSATKIDLHGCGLGNNLELIEAIKTAFSTTENSPIITASKEFEYYVSDEENAKKVSKHLANFWTVDYKMGYEPSQQKLINDLNRKYPEASIDWRKALNNETAHESGDVFHYSFDVPVKWIFPFDECVEDVPVLKTKKERLNWAKQNKTIMTDLAKLELPPEKFNWWFRNIYIENDDCSKTPALWIKGYCTKMCVLELP